MFCHMSAKIRQETHFELLMLHLHCAFQSLSKLLLGHGPPNEQPKCIFQLRNPCTTRAARQMSLSDTVLFDSFPSGSEWSTLKQCCADPFRRLQKTSRSSSLCANKQKKATVQVSEIPPFPFYMLWAPQKTRKKVIPAGIPYINSELLIDISWTCVFAPLLEIDCQSLEFFKNIKNHQSFHISEPWTGLIFDMIPGNQVVYRRISCQLRIIIQLHWGSA